MTPQEKAKGLVYKFYTKKSEDDLVLTIYWTSAKGCALLAVDEIMEFMKMDDEYNETLSNANSKWIDYWQQVKKEINNL
jgi:hypothetical protein